MNRLYNQVMANTKRSTWGGSRPGAGRRRRATAQRNGRVYVALDMIDEAIINGVVFRHALPSGVYSDRWYVGGFRFTDYAAAAAEFVRRVNG